ncbi:amino acid adenylation domain-containing protein [Streptomyces sp. NPDC005899]|uniref:non-ribosomal peptide synthetase n=1 Tax=Streptomyces sp. NPDC005899 TaxID=3155716 RepID=UPI0033D339FF
MSAPVTHEGTAAVPPVPVMPPDRPRRPGVRSLCTAVERTELRWPAPIAGAPADRVLLAGFAAFLHRFTGQDSIELRWVGGPDGPGGAQVKFGADAGLRSLAAAVTRVPSADAPVGVRFVGAGDDDGPAPGLELEFVARAGSDDGHHVLELHYDARLYDAATAARWLRHCVTLVEDGVRSPETPIAGLRLMDDAQLHRTLVEWNRTEADLPHDVCLHRAFEARAAADPDAVAVVHGEERWSYGRVDTEANRLAHHLLSLGVGPDDRVGLCLDRTPALLVAVLGVLKAGGAYVPLDPAYPAQRLATMVEGTSCAVMISRSDLAAGLAGAAPAGATPLILLDRDADVLAAADGSRPDARCGPENLCYIIHTSGSTGTPKPIALRHSGVMNNLADLNTRFAVGPGDAALALSSPSFDMSVYEFLGLTVAGGTVVVPEAARVHDPAHWIELIRAHGVTIWNSAPALLGLLADAVEQTGAGPLPTLRLALLGGDWVPVPLPGRVRDFAPALRFVVMGGATEASIHSTLFEVEEADPGWTSIPYGRPMANQRAYILDAGMRPVPPGVPGELYLAGTGLARGYLGRPELTAERFVDWSYGGFRDERLYRTGDLARFGEDGLIELLGRIDFQVKVNGLRVEVGEIETALRAVPGVRQTAVAARGGRLVGYVVPTDPRTPAGPFSAELRAATAERLPGYMVPHTIMVLPSLPLTPNGKLDRAGLPEPAVGTAVYRAPRTGPEEALAAVFADVLGRERVGADDDFIALGGDSIGAIQVVTRARARALEVTAGDVLRHRTVAALAEVAGATAAEDGTGAAEGAPLVTVDERDLRAWRRRHPGLTDVWPLTPMQSGMLFASLLDDTGPDTYHVQTLYHLSGDVDAAALRAAATALLGRHPALRVAFVRAGTDELVQIVVDGLVLPWRELDLGGLPEAEQEAAFGRFLAEDRTDRFDLAVPPLLRTALVRFGVDRAVLVLSVHHALLDGWSEQVIGQELLRLCATGGDAPAPAADGFRAFLRWLSRQDAEASARAWAAELEGVGTPTLMAPAAPAHAQAGGIGEVVIPLTPGERQAMAEVAGRGVTVNTLVQGAWAVLLSAFTGRRDVVFGATVSGRPGALAEVESTVGLFINTVPVRVDCAPDGSVDALLSDLREHQTELMDHHHRGLSDIHRDAGAEVLFDTLLVFQSYPADRAGSGTTAAAGFGITRVESLGGVDYPLALFVERDRMTLQYHRNRFGRRAAEVIADRFRAVVARMAATPDASVGGVAGVTEADRRLVAADGAGAAAPSDAPKRGAAYRAGRNPLEVELCGLFAEILGAERVGIDDRFFDLGGNSLMAGRLVSRMRRQLGLTVSMRMIFQYPTVAELSEHARAGKAASRPQLRRRPR